MLVSLRGEAELVCRAEGVPRPEVLWFRGAKPLYADNNTAVFTGPGEDSEGRFNDGQRVVVRAVGMKDLGEYTCLARNGGADTRERVFSLELEPPRQLENVTLETIQVNFGGEATMKCPVPPGEYWH